MASIIIKEAKVERLIGNKGFSCSTSYKTRAGEDKKEYFTIWTDDLRDVQEGRQYDIRGIASVRLEEWDDKTTGEKRRKAAFHVNEPNVTASEKQDSSGSYDLQAPVKDIWPEVKDVNAGEPF